MICTRCLYDDTIPGITFDADGVCSYCRIHDELDAAYPTGAAGWEHLERLAERIRKQQIGQSFDVVVGVSGGCDSSYTLWVAHNLGLRCAAVHFDNTWNTATAARNIRRVCKALDVPLFTYVVDNHEYDSISRAFLRAGVRDFEAPTDIALTTILYRYAERLGTRWIFNGHSFRTEGIAPLGWSYMDGRYIADVCQKHGGPDAFKTFPNLWIREFLRFSLAGFKRIRPLYYIEYNKEFVKQELSHAFGWQWYGGHHHENELTAFFMYYLLPTRFNIDLRKLGWSALVRSGQLDRGVALERISRPPALNEWWLYSVKSRLGISDGEFADMMAQPLRTHLDYRTYKPIFERTRPLWWALAKMGRVPESFYVKYAKRGLDGKQRSAIPANDDRTRERSLASHIRL